MGEGYHPPGPPMQISAGEDLRTGGARCTVPPMIAPLLLAFGLTAAPSVPVLAGGIQINEPEHGYWTGALSRAGLNSLQVTIYARQGAWDSADLTWPEQHEAVVSEIHAAHDAGLKVSLVLRVYLEHALPENRHLWHGMIWPSTQNVGPWFDRYAAFATWGAAFAKRHDVELFVIGNELNSMTSTVASDRLPALYGYELDPAQTDAVRARRAECAQRAAPEKLKADLVWRDGKRYTSLDASLREEQQRRQRWTTTVTGLSLRAELPGAPMPAGLAKRRAYHALRWRQLIADVRSIYDGPISYGANFDQFEQVGFWDALDLISLTGYFPLSRWGAAPADADAQMASSWQAIAERIEALSKGAGHKPVYLIELGWTGKLGSSVRPYSYVGVEALEAGTAEAPKLTCVHWASQPDAPDERIRALAALTRVVEAGLFSCLRGFSLWKLTTMAYHRPIEPFAIVLPPPHGTEDDDDAGFLAVARDLFEALEAQAPPAQE